VGIGLLLLLPLQLLSIPLQLLSILQLLCLLLQLLLLPLPLLLLQLLLLSPQQMLLSMLLQTLCQLLPLLQLLGALPLGPLLLAGVPDPCVCERCFANRGEYPDGLLHPSTSINPHLESCLGGIDPLETCATLAQVQAVVICRAVSQLCVGWAGGLITADAAA